jgi:hypothetical protein
MLDYCDDSTWDAHDRSMVLSCGCLPFYTLVGTMCKSDRRRWGDVPLAIQRKCWRGEGLGLAR